MSTTADLIQALKKELKAAQMTYADLADALGMAESSVKRMLAKGDMPLSRIDAICHVLRLDFADLARRVAENQPLIKELTQQQEQAVIADKKLLLMAICVLSQWTLEQVLATYRLSEAEGIKYLAQLDRIGIAVGMRAIRTATGHIAAQRDDMAHARLPIGPRDLVDLGARRLDAG